MNIFDSHCHLDDRTYGKDRDTVVQRAKEAGIAAMMVVGVDEQSSEKALSIANQYDGIYASVGVHPHDAKDCNEEILDRLKRLATDSKVRAWGETGLDYNRMFSPQADQEHWFVRQLQVGVDLKLPMIFHERDSRGRFLELLRANWDAQHFGGVVHCFSGTPPDLAAYLELGLHIGITGILTIKSRGTQLREMVRGIPANRLLVETDAPYLTPTPERNKFRRNEPAFVRTVLLKLAAVREEDPDALARIIWRNTCRLYGIPSQIIRAQRARL